MEDKQDEKGKAYLLHIFRKLSYLRDIMPSVVETPIPMTNWAATFSTLMEFLVGLK